MKFILKTGEIIEAKKDCECVTHDGPHWIHMDNIHKQSNWKLYDDKNTFGYAKEELARLKEKKYQMDSRGIVQIIRGENDI